MQLCAIGREIVSIQNYFGWGDAQVAVHLGVSPTTVWRWKTGQSPMRDIYIEKLRSLRASVDKTERNDE